MPELAGRYLSRNEKRPHCCGIHCSKRVCHRELSS
ncbi:hypothetical protein FHX48_001926 [Microbacterium halimionae]|uniref:Uncharacterized protein n=1 Tax=Microbacterium halimionae TaxID=1526413 RepID=A0A7W3JPZ0_9MICO|nr:hypothetical protein [Microbacterium halimionae]NII94871.1 hypothetical protein [Microbacterium halimionae]